MFFIILDEKEFKNIILWLKNNKLKNFLSNAKLCDESNWQMFYDELKKLTQCPILVDNKIAELDWFLGFSIQCSYENDSNSI